MKCIALIFAIAAVAAGETLDVTSSAQDYFLISQHQLIYEIDLVNAQIDAVDARYADRLDTIAYQQEQTTSEILRVNRTTWPLEALDLVRKYCIQTYEAKFVTVDNAKQRLKYCYDTAELAGSKLTQNSRLYTNYARNVVQITLKNNVASCDKSYPTNQTEKDSCYIKYVDQASSSVNDYLDMAQADINKSLFDANVASNTAVRCSFVVEKDVLETIADTNRIITNCEDSLNAKTSVAALIDANTVQGLIMRKITGQ